jgi:hypothetical protein
MEASAMIAHEYVNQLKKERLIEHKIKNSQEQQCKGLTNYEWFKNSTRQKSTFSKSKKFSCTRLWTHNYVPRGEEFNQVTFKTK